MVSATAASLSKTRTVVATAESLALTRKGGLSGLLDMGGAGGGMSQLNQFRDQSQNRERYALFRGHVYSAINAIALEASGQPAHVGHKAKKSKDKKPKDKKSTEHIRRKMAVSLRAKAAASELEIAEDHPLQKNLDKPNKIQTKSDFVYSFVANLCLTGWAFVVAGEKKDGGYEFYSVPTTWVHPVHDKGAFAEFKIYNPNDPQADRDTTIPGNQVGFAHFPKPSDPLGAIAPAAAQGTAIKIDDYIQSSQKLFFENGIFPSVIVTVGSNPHPNVPGGVRPRLTAPQRRQVYAAIKKVSGGIANYGNPAIVDGLIEKIERLSATQNEMGWEKSEKAVRSRILSAFGVHPFILGEEMAGSYAQAYIVQDRFFKRVNTFLDMLSVVMTGFVGEDGFIKESEDLLIWWEECKAVDPSMEKATWEAARNRDDVSQNEFRAWMGLPPDEDQKEAVINKSIFQHVAKVAADATAGTITPEQAMALLEGLGLPEELAEEIVGEGPPEPDPNAMAMGLPGQPGMPGQPPQPGQPGVPPKPGQQMLPGAQQQPGAKPQKPKKPTPEEALESADMQLRHAIAALKAEPARMMAELVERSSLIDESAVKGWCQDPNLPPNSCGPDGLPGSNQKPTGAAKPPKKPETNAGGRKPAAAKPPKKPAAAKPQKPSKPPKKPVDPEVAAKLRRSQTVIDARRLGFKPTSKDKWINEQQAIEFMDARIAKRKVAEARKAGYKPTSSDDVIAEMQAREFLRKKGTSGPKLDTSNKKLQSITKKLKATPPKTAEQRAALMKAIKDSDLKRSDVWSNFKKASKQLMDYHVQNFKTEAKDKGKQFMNSMLNKVFSNQALVARVSSMILGEDQF